MTNILVPKVFGLLKCFVFAFSAPLFSVGGALHVAYVTNRNCLVQSMCMWHRIMYEIAAFCRPKMRKKNSSIPRVVSTININISGDLKYSVNGSNNVYLFSYNIATASSF